MASRDDAHIRQVEGLYAFARAIGNFADGFYGVAGSVSSSAQSDLSLARQWLNQLRGRMDDAYEEMQQLRYELDSYTPNYDEDGTDTTYYIYERLADDYSRAAAAYDALASRYSQAEARFQQIWHLIDTMQQTANRAANAIARLGADAKGRVTRGADIISNEYNR